MVYLVHGFPGAADDETIADSGILAAARTALHALRERVPADMLIEASEEDLARFGVNAVSVGRQVVMAPPGGHLRSVLAERGYGVVPLDLTPFMMSGSGAYCMTLRLDRAVRRQLHPDPVALDHQEQEKAGDEADGHIPHA